MSEVWGDGKGADVTSAGREGCGGTVEARGGGGISAAAESPTTGAEAKG